MLEKGGILVLTSSNLEKKRLILMSSVLSWNRAFILAENSVFYHKKGGPFWTEKSVFYCNKGIVLSWKVSVSPQKRGSFSNWRTWMGTNFSSERESLGVSMVLHVRAWNQIAPYVSTTSSTLENPFTLQQVLLKEMLEERISHIINGSCLLSGNCLGTVMSNLG